jgi:lysophospholipase L1-like esterase
MPKPRRLSLSLLVSLTYLGAGCNTTETPTTPGTGGSLSSGGAVSTGGITATGGVATATGGATNSGGAPTGGAAATTGGKATGGTPSTGGSAATGGKATGGSTAGGSSAGGSSTGGRATGGASTTGGVMGTGGKATGGGATGGSGATTCSAPSATALAVCTGTNPIACHFGVNPGNYEVTVVLGGGTTAGSTYVEAETSRRMRGTIATGAGQTQRFTFVVNVRQPEGQPIQAVSAGTPGLDVYFAGTAPQLQGIGYCVATNPVVVYIAGDSTVCDQTDTNYAGWGQFLPQHLNTPVSVANYADSGESSSSFVGSGSLWGAIKSRLKANDWVMIQLGHNDKTTPSATLRQNFTTMVNDTKAKGAFPVLITPISRIGYTLAEQHVWVVGTETVNIPQIIRDLGTQLGVPVIDLTVTTYNWEVSLGSGWTNYFALGSDHTHTNQQGADVISGFVRDALRTQNIALSGYLR